MSSTGNHLVSLHDAAPAREQWIHLLPAGTFMGRDGRGPYRVDDPVAVMTATREYHGKAQMPADYEHQIDHAPKNGKPAPAAGWIKGLEARADGIWGLVEWTSAAHRAIQAREYRYISPVFYHGRDGRVTRLARVALTNTPNLELKALNSAGDPMDIIEELRQLLALPEDAEQSAILAKIRSLIDGPASGHAAIDPAKFVPIGDFERVVSELNQVKRGVTESEAKHAVEMMINGRKLPPFLRDWGISLCTVNKPAFDAFVDRVSPNIARLFEPSVASASPPDGGGSGLSDEEQAVCSAMNLTPEELRRTRRSS